MLPILLTLAVSGCRPDCTPHAEDLRPNVVLVTIDTLRADRLGCYGNTTVRTPHLDELATAGTIFLRAYSQTHVTVPSHVSIFSSLPMARHGVLTNSAVPPRHVEVLLPQLFADAGYQTAAFVSARHLGRGGPLGVALGESFDIYRSTAEWTVPLRAEKTTRRFLRWLHKACRRPFFAWVHYWDPHMPYAPPPPFDTMYYQGNPYASHHTSLVGVPLGLPLYDLSRLHDSLGRQALRVRSLKRDFHLQSRKVDRLLLSPDALAPGTQENDLALRRRLASLREAVRKDLPFNSHVADWLTGVRDLDFPRARYAGEVSYVDRQIGRVRAELERLGLAERTILVITADHGESLGEHGVYFDHNGLYEPNLRVPFIVWAPGLISSSRRLDLVGSLDVAPTILGLADMEIPAAMHGRDLFANDTREKPLFAESDYRRQIMIRDGHWKLIRTLARFYYVDAFAPRSGTIELYDLASDPGERNNVANYYPQITRDLTARLDTWNAEQTAQVPARPTVHPEAIEGLRALGYLE